MRTTTLLLLLLAVFSLILANIGPVPDAIITGAQTVEAVVSVESQSDDISLQMISKMRASIKVRYSEIKNIFEHYLFDGDRLSGIVEVEIMIVEGEVAEANINQNTTGNTELANKIISAVSEWNIYCGKGTAIVNVTFMLRSIAKARAVYPNIIVIEKSDEITLDMVDKITNYIYARGGQIKRIYQRHLAENHGIAGRIIVCMLIVDGKVTDALIEQDTIGNIGLADEISSAICDWQVRGVEGFVSVNAVFVLQPL